MTNEILHEQDGAILRITLNRPEAGNGMTDAMAAELTRLIDGAADSAHFIILRGAGEDFCTGRAQAKSAKEARPEALERRRQSDVIFNCYGAFRRSPVPIIAVVQGRALGFGCAIAALADITLAGEAARFQLPEMSHNIMPTMAMSSLVDRVPLKALSYLTYSTAVIGPERALSFGIVSEVVPDEGLEQALQTLCTALSKAPRPAIHAVKEYVRSALSMDIQAAVDFARNLHATVNSSSEMRKSGA
jgi:enoyl-CoA hydratase